MTIELIFSDKSLKPKARTEMLCTQLQEGNIALESLLTFASAAKDPERATCIEVLEYTTKENPDFLTLAGFEFVSSQLNSKSPRVLWESARVIGNAAKNFPDQLEDAIGLLVPLMRFDGTVVRWSVAYALGEIIQIKGAHRDSLRELFQEQIAWEEKNSIRKIYEKALKKIA